jgi:hypothetical protein
MSKSRKKPFSRITNEDSKYHKKLSSRAFRQQENMMIRKGKYDLLPYLNRHVFNPWFILDIAPIYKPEDPSAYRK